VASRDVHQGATLQQHRRGHGHLAGLDDLNELPARFVQVLPQFLGRYEREVLNVLLDQLLEAKQHLVRTATGRSAQAGKALLAA